MAPMVWLAAATDTVSMEIDRDACAGDAVGTIGRDRPDTETWIDVDGVMVIPATGTGITADLVRQMVDEDRERHIPDLARQG